MTPFKGQLEIYHALAGAGKTTTLMNLINQEVEDGTPLSKIAFVSFTKAAATVAQERAQLKFGVPVTSKDLIHFRTLHSMCFRETQSVRMMMMDKEKYRAFGQVSDFSFGRVDGDLIEGIDWSVIKDQYLILIEQLYRNNQSYATAVLDRAPPITSKRLVTYMNLYQRYKRERGYRDFTDLLQMYVNSDKVQDVEIAFVDEAQDMTPLQWQVVFTAFRNCRKIYIAGDSNQCIYRFAGAEASILVHMKGNLHYLSNSYRVPENIMNAASLPLNRIVDKVDMPWNVLHPGGIVKHLFSMLEFPGIEPNKTYFFLSRNRKFLKEYVQWCHENAYPYYMDTTPVFTAEDKLEYSQKRTRHWDIVKLDFAERCDRRGRFYEDPQIRISTIHGVKGDEADVVLLKTDVSQPAYDSLKKYDPDSEHRCFFVATTRAKQALYILEPQTKFYYKI